MVVLKKIRTTANNMKLTVEIANTYNEEILFGEFKTNETY